MKSQEVALSVTQVRARRKLWSCCLSQYSSLREKVVPYRDAGRGSGHCREWGFGLGGRNVPLPSLPRPIPLEVEPCMPCPGYPPGCGRWYGQQCWQLLVSGPFSIAGKVPRGVCVRPSCSLLWDTVVLAPSQGVAGESQVYHNQLLQVNCSVL